MPNHLPPLTLPGGYTGGQMFQLPDGTLLETAAIHVRAASAGVADPTQSAEASA
jgi:hypothetical protein